MTRLSSLIFSLFLIPSLALAAAPEPWQINLQAAATPVHEKVHEFHNLLLVIITGIVVIVTALLFYTLWRYRAKKSPNPSNTTHNVKLEVIWTLIPCLILLVIAVPSFKLMYFMDRTVEPDMTLKVTGYQWYWGYEYMDEQFEGINFFSYMIPDDEIDTSKGQLRTLETDNPVVVPVNKNVRVLLTAADVIHSWAVPAFGVKTDAVPGRVNETWFRVTKPGMYYGQCSEICGINHGFMPIQIKAVPQDEFEAWVTAKKTEG